MTRLLSIIVALVLPTITLSQSAAAQTVSTNIKTTKASVYKNKSLGWKFTMPSSWTKEELDPKANQILVLQKEKGKNVFKASLHPTPKVDEEILNNYIEFLKRKMEDHISKIDLTTTFKDGIKTIEGRKFHYLDYIVTDARKQIVGLYNSYYRIMNGKIFEVTINSENKEIQAEILSAWNASVKSLKK